jgi:hypothetical protein
MVLRLENIDKYIDSRAINPPNCNNMSSQELIRFSQPTVRPRCPPKRKVFPTQSQLSPTAPDQRENSFFKNSPNPSCQPPKALQNHQTPYEHWLMIFPNPGIVPPPTTYNLTRPQINQTQAFQYPRTPRRPRRTGRARLQPGHKDASSEGAYLAAAGRSRAAGVTTELP